ncbi:MAG: type II toxin-antitoxin system VapC family toxin [Terracidiphilus sp.]|nr:type II toxin-antitoxin system VapC family toxin [Terracidiphilus sp.]
MTYLLDTHTLIWFLRRPEALPALVRSLIEDPESTLAISLATPWEMSIKTSIGRLDARDILEDFESIMARGRFNLLVPTVSQVIHSGWLPWYHRDPFDRLLAAQTLELGWSLLSKDTVFDAYGVRRLWS